MYLIVDSFCNAQKSPWRWEIGVTDKPLKFTPLDGVWLSWLKHQLGIHEAGLGEQLLGIIHWWNPQLEPRIFFFKRKNWFFMEWLQTAHSSRWFPYELCVFNSMNANTRFYFLSPEHMCLSSRVSFPHHGGKHVMSCMCLHYLLAFYVVEMDATFAEIL